MRGQGGEREHSGRLSLNGKIDKQNNEANDFNTMYNTD